MKKQFKAIAIIILIASMMSSCSREQKDPSTEFKLQIDKYVEFWNTGEFDGINDLLSEDFELRVTPQFEPETGINTFMETVLNVRKSYPGFHITEEEILYSANAVTARWTIQATSKTGKEMNIMGMSILHFVDGKIKDEWISNNDLQWLKQLDYIIMPPSTDKEK